jgi:hypothetical protein
MPAAPGSRSDEDAGRYSATDGEGIGFDSESGAEAAAPAQQPAPQSGRRYIRTAAFAACLTLLASLGLALSRPIVYRAESRLAFDPLPSRIPGGPAAPAVYKAYLERQARLAISPDVLTAALDRLPARDQSAAAVASLARRVQATPNPARRQLAIGLTGPDPIEDAAEANAITLAYLQLARRHEAGPVDPALLEAERERTAQLLNLYRAELAGGPRAQQELKPAASGPAGTQAAAATKDAQAAHEAWVAARGAHDQACRLLLAVLHQGGFASDQIDTIAQQIMDSDPVLSSMQAEINLRRNELSGTGAAMKPQDKKELARLDDSLESLQAQLRVKAAWQLEDRLKQQLAQTGDAELKANTEARQAAASPSAVQQRGSDLSAWIPRLQGRLDELQADLDDVRFQGSAPIHLLSAAKIPATPEPNRRSILLLAALPIALLTGYLVVVLANRLGPQLAGLNGPIAERFASLGARVASPARFLADALRPRSAPAMSRSFAIAEPYTAPAAAPRRSIYAFPGEEELLDPLHRGNRLKRRPEPATRGASFTCPVPPDREPTQPIELDTEQDTEQNTDSGIERNTKSNLTTIEGAIEPSIEDPASVLAEASLFYLPPDAALDIEAQSIYPAPVRAESPMSVLPIEASAEASQPAAALIEPQSLPAVLPALSPDPEDSPLLEELVSSAIQSTAPSPCALALIQREMTPRYFGPVQTPARRASGPAGSASSEIGSPSTPVIQPTEIFQPIHRKPQEPEPSAVKLHSKAEGPEQARPASSGPAQPRRTPIDRWAVNDSTDSSDMPPGPVNSDPVQCEPAQQPPPRRRWTLLEHFDQPGMLAAAEDRASAYKVPHPRTAAPIFSEEP